MEINPIDNMYTDVIMGSQDGLTALDVASISSKGDSALVYEVLSKQMQDSAIVTLHAPVSVISDIFVHIH